MIGFREQLLNYIYNQLCGQLVIPDPKSSYQNDINNDLDKLQLGNASTAISLQSSVANLGVRYLAPRQPNGNFNTPLRCLYNRPITQVDIAGLRIDSNTKLPEVNTPSAFIHIVTAEKDLYFPSRRIPAEGTLKDQIEFLKIGIDCVLRDETEPIAGTNFKGNGKFWESQTRQCLDPPLLPKIRDYQPLYHKPINHQAVGFVEDTESILNAGSLRNLILKFGPGGQYQAVIMNVLLAVWGMLPDAENSPTDTVRCIYEFEIHYPKIYGL